jgi:hypothetical protein
MLDTLCVNEKMILKKITDLVGKLLFIYFGGFPSLAKFSKFFWGFTLQ